MLTNKRLILAHFWLAFIVFGAALVLGAWQMFVRSPLNAWHFNPEFYYRSVTAHGSAMGYVFPTLIAMGFGYAITEAALEKPLVGRRWAWAGFSLVAVGAVVAMIPVSLGLASVLYTFYPPMVGNPFYYIGVVMVVVGSWIWVALMSINLAALEAGQSRQAGAAGDVRQCRGRLSLGLDRGRRCARDHLPDPAGGARPAVDHRRRAGAGVLLLDAACDRLFLADPDLHRLLHDLSARDRRPALQRRHGADFLHPVRRGGDADRRASSVCRSAGRRRLQVHAFGIHRAGRAADAADGVHDLRLGRDRQPAARRPRRVRLGHARCPGRIRSCWRPRCRWSCLASAAPAG